MDARSRHRGCLLGLACGDAVGTTLEFRPRGSFAPIEDMLGGGPFGLEAGQWTDDTSMALCLARSLVERGGFDARDQMERYVGWWSRGDLSSNGRCFDIGSTVRAALARFLETGEPFVGSTHPRSAGNGSIMRLAPVVMFCAPDHESAVRHAGESSRTTHGCEEAVDACRLLAAVLSRALAGAAKEDVLRGPAPPALAPAIEAIASGVWREKGPESIRGSGYVVDCLEAALWCVDRTGSFREAVLAAANLGDDADTTTAVTGQIAGALYGEDGIPASWRAKLARRALLEETADALFEATPGTRG